MHCGNGQKGLTIFFSLHVIKKREKEIVFTSNFSVFFNFRMFHLKKRIQLITQFFRVEIAQSYNDYRYVLCVYTFIVQKFPNIKVKLAECKHHNAGL